MNNLGYENARVGLLVEVRVEGLILNKNKVTASPSGKPRLQQRQVEVYEG
jgi:hypothetical protein